MRVPSPLYCLAPNNGEPLKCKVISMTKLLFDSDYCRASNKYSNLRGAIEGTRLHVRQMLETLWSEYRPYADSQFPTKFAVETEQRFWEMYLTCYLLEHGKHVIPRDDPRTKGKGDCPDIAINDGSRIVWVESVAPTSGDPNNRNSVPPLATNSPEDEEFSAHTVNPELIVLRVTSALKDKREQIAKYREQGLIHPNDLSIIAISGGAIDTSFLVDDIIEAAQAVYPIGNQYVTVNVASGEPVDSGRVRSQSIPKVTKGGGTTPICQNAFLDGHTTKFPA